MGKQRAQSKKSVLLAAIAVPSTDWRLYMRKALTAARHPNTMRKYYNNKFGSRHRLGGKPIDHSRKSNAQSEVPTDTIQ